MSTTSDQKLFTPYAIGAIQLSNRVVMAPMTRSRADQAHVPTEIMIEYYKARAAAGLIITEGVAPDANGAGYARIPGLWSQAQIEAWRPITAAVHEAGGKIAVQLMHTGRASHPLNLTEGGQVLAPSAVALGDNVFTDAQGPQGAPTPTAMSDEQVKQAIQGYAQAAKNAIEAGFDMVELHGANGYLIDQFISPNTNQRDDQWGGASIEQRGSFALAVAKATIDAIGAERVGIRLSPFGVFNGILPWDSIAEDFTWLAQQLSALGLAYLHIVDHSAMGAPALPEGFKQQLRAAFDQTFILSGGYDAARAEADLQEDRGDLVAFGRPFISNPDLVERLRTGAALTPPDFSTFYTPGPEGYNDYPTR